MGHLLFVANCSKQPHDFLYRLPEEQGRVRQQKIPAGGQERIHNESPLTVLKGIIGQHEIYGMIPVSEVSKRKHFIGLCYSFDKPIDVESIMVAAENNDVVLTEQGREIRKTAAAALDGQVSNTLSEAGAEVHGFEVEVIEEATRGRDTQIAETIEVVSQGRQGRSGSRRGRRSE